MPDAAAGPPHPDITHPDAPPPLDVVEDAIVMIERTRKRHRGRIFPRCAEVIARQFHARYERLSAEHGWSTQQSTRVPWDELPEANRSLMLATIADLLAGGVIRCGEH